MRDFAVKPIVWTGVAIALTVAAVVAAVLGALEFRGMAAGGDRFRFGHANPWDAPGLASAPQDELARERRQQDARLHSAGWIDRPAGIAHIPIEEAMDRLVAKQEKP